MIHSPEVDVGEVAGAFHGPEVLAEVVLAARADADAHAGGGAEHREGGVLGEGKMVGYSNQELCCKLFGCGTEVFPKRMKQQQRIVGCGVRSHWPSNTIHETTTTTTRRSISY